jgi:hypothetical protein
MFKVNYYLVLFIVLFMTLTNILIFCRYKHCKFDWPYVFVLLTYNIDYLVKAAIAIFKMTKTTVE